MLFALLLMGACRERAQMDDSGDGSALLASLVVDGGKLVPAFDPDQQHYQVFVDGSKPMMSVLAEPADARAEAGLSHQDIDGAELDSGARDSITVTGQEGHKVLVEVTATTGEEARTSIVFVPPDFPTLEVRTSEPAATDGYFVLSPFPLIQGDADVAPFLSIVDNRGVPVWYRRLQAPGQVLRPNPDGRLSYVATIEGGGNEAVLLGEDYASSSVYAPHPTTDGAAVALDAHELRVLESGNVVIFGLSGREVDMTPWGAEDGCCLILDNVIQELDPQGKVVFQWNSKDHISFEGLPDVFTSNIRDFWEYAHINSLAIDPADGNWIVSVRYHSQVIKIARAETNFRGEAFAPGEIVWRLGGLQSDFEIVGDQRAKGWQGFSFQHSASMPEPGRLVVYDNASWPDLGVLGESRYVEYALDFDAMTATKVAEHALAGSLETPVAGSVERLDDGGTLIGWGSLFQTTADAPAFTELDAEGRVVVEMGLPYGQVSYRVFKAQRRDGGWMPLH